RPGTGALLAAELREAAAPFPALPDTLRYAGPLDLFRTEPFQAGRFELQDLASQLVGHLCAPQPGETWWDACAGEGGKMLHLSDLMQNRGLIWASDRSARRLAALRLRAARARCFNWRAAPWDGGLRLPTRTRFDGVLLDAPCTGLGTWGR
ncbi:MAG TPA: 16S rRNA (cytosine(967)-C(5))-methyltransferase, partial [Verrucomicrobiota bacterium]|nr:16S rRNA (cytosine(967)-C(5))-methyltransferase [Verrucomicrobiota bacterium]